MDKPVSVKAICIYIFIVVPLTLLSVGAIILMPGIDYAANFSHPDVIMIFTFAASAFLLVFAIGLWNAHLWSRKLFIFGYPFTVFPAWLFMEPSGMVVTNLLIAIMIYFLVLYLLYREPVENFLYMDQGEFVEWHDGYRIYGVIKSTNSEASKFIGVVMMAVGVIIAGFMCLFLASGDFVLNMFAIGGILVSLVFLFAGFKFWGWMRVNMTGGLSMIAIGALWILNMFGLYIAYYTPVIADFANINAAEFYETIGLLYNELVIFTVFVVGLLLVAGGILSIRLQLDADRDDIANGRFRPQPNQTKTPAQA